MTETTELDLTIDSLGAGGDGVGRDATGRVTFVPRTAPGDLVRIAVTSVTKSFARGKLVEVLAPGPDRIAAPCPHFAAGCGGCQWQHLTRAAQLTAKQDIVARALRKLDGLTVHPIDGTTPDYGWRRRARFHVSGGRVGLFVEDTHTLVPIAACPQLEPALDVAVQEIAGASPPDGELVFVLGRDGDVVAATESRWRVPPRLKNKGGLRGVIAAGEPHGATTVTLEGSLVCGPWDFAQASVIGNRVLGLRAAAALGPGPGMLLELHAGAGNLTRAYASAGWSVIPSDLVAPAVKPANFLVGHGVNILGRAPQTDAIALDPPRTGCADEVPGILARRPKTIVYVSCDPATLARDLVKLVAGGYRATDAWPIDLMPQTSHVEVVVRLTLP